MQDLKGRKEDAVSVSDAIVKQANEDVTKKLQLNLGLSLSIAFATHLEAQLAEPRKGHLASEEQSFLDVTLLACPRAS